MTAFVRSRHIIPLLCVCFAAVTLIFSPWGSAPAPYLDLGLPAPLVPLRAIALVALGYLPLLTLSPETQTQDRSSPRSAWLLQAAAPTAFTVISVAAVVAGATVAGMDASGAVRNLLLGTAAAAALRPVMGPLAFLPAVLAALLCAALREQQAWWAITNQPGTLASLLFAAILAAAALSLASLQIPTDQLSAH